MREGSGANACVSALRMGMEVKSSYRAYRRRRQACADFAQCLRVRHIPTREGARAFCNAGPWSWWRTYLRLCSLKVCKATVWWLHHVGCKRFTIRSRVLPADCCLWQPRAHLFDQLRCSVLNSCSAGVITCRECGSDRRAEVSQVELAHSGLCYSLHPAA